jgi:hypothetical protein
LGARFQNAWRQARERIVTFTITWNGRDGTPHRLGSLDAYEAWMESDKLQSLGMARVVVMDDHGHVISFSDLAQLASPSTEPDNAPTGRKGQ